MRHEKLFLRAEFGPLWEPWEEDEIGRKVLSANFDEAAKLCKASDYYILGGYIANLARSSKRKGSRR